MLLAHGWGQLSGFSEMSGAFPDPLGLGSAASLGLMVFAEVFCSLGLIVGLATRPAAMPLAIGMAVAAFVQHASDPWQKKELAVVYLVVYIAIACTGAGRWSLDHLIARRLSAERGNSEAGARSAGQTGGPSQ